MMKMLGIIAEGDTEVAFINNVLVEYLLDYDICAVPLKLPTSKHSKGGWRRSDGYAYAVKQIRQAISQAKYPFFTTLFDFYGFPADIPCRDDAQRLTSPYDKVHCYEEQLKRDVINESGAGYHCQFLPYVQPYEFEALVFVNPKIASAVLGNGDERIATKLMHSMQLIRNGFDTPEHINNSFETAPSKRLEALVPGYIKNKAGVAGFSWRVPHKIGLEEIRNQCKHFDEWVTKLASLSV